MVVSILSNVIVFNDGQSNDDEFKVSTYFNCLLAVCMTYQKHERDTTMSDMLHHPNYIMIIVHLYLLYDLIHQGLLILHILLIKQSKDTQYTTSKCKIFSGKVFQKQKDSKILHLQSLLFILGMNIFKYRLNFTKKTIFTLIFNEYWSTTQKNKRIIANTRFFVLLNHNSISILFPQFRLSLHQIYYCLCNI